MLNREVSTDPYISIKLLYHILIYCASAHTTVHMWRITFWSWFSPSIIEITGVKLRSGLAGVPNW